MAKDQAPEKRPEPNGPLQQGTMRVVAPERRAQMAIDAGTWSLSSWPMPDPRIEAERAALAEGPGEVTDVHLYREVWAGCWQLAYAAGSKVPEDQRPGLVTHDEMQVLARGGAA